MLSWARLSAFVPTLSRPGEGYALDTSSCRVIPSTAIDVPAPARRHPRARPREDIGRPHHDEKGSDWRGDPRVHPPPRGGGGGGPAGALEGGALRPAARGADAARLVRQAAGGQEGRAGQDRA